MIAGSAKRRADAAATTPSASASMSTSGGGNANDLDTVQEFQGLRGSLLVEAIFAKYGQGAMTIPWLNPQTGERNIRRDPCNRPIMESLAEAYCDRILESGPNVDCSGRAWMVCGNAAATLPANAITYNHRISAFLPCTIISSPYGVGIGVMTHDLHGFHSPSILPATKDRKLFTGH